MPEKTWKISVVFKAKHIICRAEGNGGKVRLLELDMRGVLKTRVVRMVDPGCMQLEKNWGISGEILAGYHIRSASQPGSSRLITTYNPDRSRICFEGKWYSDLTGLPVEITAFEHPLILAARLLTSSALKQELPPVVMELTIDEWATESMRSLIRIASIQHSRSEDPYMLSVKENIGPDGEIIYPLRESEINNLLRQVYRHPGSPVLIHLENSLANPIHEEILGNLLHTAGYSKIYFSHRLDSLIRLFSAVEGSELKDLINKLLQQHFKHVTGLLGEGSRIQLCG